MNLTSKKLGDSFTAKDKLKVNTTIQILNIFEVDEVQSLLTLKLNLILKWIDVRHKYFNLNKNSDMNSIPATKLEEIWTPELVFVNTKNSHRVNLKNESSVVSIEIIKSIYSFMFNISFKSMIHSKFFQKAVPNKTHPI